MPSQLMQNFNGMFLWLQKRFMKNPFCCTIYMLIYIIGKQILEYTTDW